MRQREIRALQQLAGGPENAVRFRRGTVTDDSPFTITLGGSDVAHAGVHYLSSYTPTVSDSVAVLVWGNDLLVLGKIL